MAGHDHTPGLHEHTDSWHHHSAAEGAPQHEHTSIANPSVLIHWLILIIVCGVTVIISLGMYFGKYYDQVRRAKIETLDFYNWPGGAHERLDKAEHDLGLTQAPAQYTYHIANAQAHTVQLPIEDAMKKVVEKYKAPKTAQAPSSGETTTKN